MNRSRLSIFLIWGICSISACPVSRSSEWYGELTNFPGAWDNEAWSGVAVQDAVIVSTQDWEGCTEHLYRTFYKPCKPRITIQKPKNTYTIKPNSTFVPPECWTGHGTLVWDQPVDCYNGTGYSSQYDTAYPFESRTADDFLFTTAPANGIRFVTWYGQYWGGYPGAPITAFNIYIYNDSGS